MKRGEVFWAELRPRSGSEQSGRRPVVILTHDAFNMVEGWRSIIVVPISTSARQMKRGPTVVSLAAGTAGLEKSSVALCHQITTIDRGKLTARIGALPAELLSRLEKAVLAAVGIIP